MVNYYVKQLVHIKYIPFKIYFTEKYFKVVHLVSTTVGAVKVLDALRIEWVLHNCRRRRPFRASPVSFGYLRRHVSEPPPPPTVHVDPAW